MGKVKVRSEAQCTLELGRPTRMGFTQATAETSYPRKEAEVTVALGSSPLRHKSNSYGRCVCCKHGGKHCGCSPKWQRSRDGMRKNCLGQKAVDCAKNCIQGAIQASGNRWSVSTTGPSFTSRQPSLCQVHVQSQHQVWGEKKPR